MGLLAGLGGSYIALVTTGSFSENIAAGQGWIALAAVIFGRWKPFWIVIGALVYGMVNALGTGSPDNGLSHTISIPANAAISFTYCYFSCNV